MLFGTSTLGYAQPNWLNEGTQFIIIGGAEPEFEHEDAVSFLLEYRHEDYQGTKAPHYVITDKRARAMFSIGGFVNFRTAYDFNAVMPNLDFIPADIPMQKNFTNMQRALMDASTSRLFFESVIHTGWDMPITAYIETDFRGPGHSLRLRQAYVSLAGFKFGQATSTFTDINSAFRTIDFEGPNAYTYTRNLMAQYTCEFESGLGMGIALEYPMVNAEYSGTTLPIYQRVPDVPLYVQYKWGESGNESHIRVSGILRNMFYGDLVSDVDVDRIGWGVQASGRFVIGDWLKLYGQFLYGEGMADYIQDLQGLPYDMVENAYQPGEMLAVPAMAYFLGAEFMLTPKVPMTVGYSQVSVFDKDNSVDPYEYHIGQYIVANCFYDFNPAISAGVEYLYGAKHDFMDGFGSSSRVQVAVQFNF